MENNNIFLTEDQVDDMTEIKRGKAGQNKYQRQATHLRQQGIPFTESARGRPIVARSAIEGRTQPGITTKAWQPKQNVSNRPAARSSWSAAAVGA